MEHRFPMQEISHKDTKPPRTAVEAKIGNLYQNKKTNKP
jgi:hypothetical protein